MPRFRLAALAAVFALLVAAPTAFADITATVSGGTLTVTGDTDDDIINIRFDSGSNDYIVDQNSGGNATDGGGCAEAGSDVNTARCERTGALNIVVNSGDGDDEVVLDFGPSSGGSSTDDPSNVDLGSGNDFGAIHTGTGGAPDPNDDMFGGTGNDVMFDGAPILGGAFGTAPGPGNDHFIGGEGDDVIHTSAGDDEVQGGPGDDTMTPSDGADDFHGDSGNDVMQLREASDNEGFQGNSLDPATITLDDVADDGKNGQGANVHSDVDDIYSDIGDDTIRGAPGTQFLLGDRGNDNIDPGTGTDAVSGQDGDDTISLRDGSPDAARCGSGFDTVTADGFDLVDQDCEVLNVPLPDTFIDSGPADGSTIGDNMPTFTFHSDNPNAHFECQVDRRLRSCTSPFTTEPLSNGTHTVMVRAIDELSNLDDSLAQRTFTVAILPGSCTNTRSQHQATQGSNVIEGTRGGDRVNALGGNDRVELNRGNDCGSGGDGRDKLFGDDGKDRLSGNDARDKLYGGASNDRLNGGDDDDLLEGGDGGDRLTGGDGDDTIKTGSGKNSVSAGDGDDSVNSANGRRDRVTCGSGTDTVRADPADSLSGCERVRRV